MLPVKQLTPQEEKDLIKIVLQDKELHGLLFRGEISTEYYEKKQQESLLARDKLVISNLPYVVKMAHRYRTKAPIEELISAGTIGLLLSINYFDPSKNSRFLTFAGYYIVNEMLDHINKCSFIPIPQPVRETLTKIESARASFFIEHQRQPTIKEISEITGLTEDRIVEINKHKKIYELGKIDSKELMSFNQPNRPSDSMDIERVVSSLADREQQIVRMYYGFNPFSKEHTLQEIGDRLSLTKERVRQIKDSAIQKIACFPSIMEYAT